MSCHGLAAGFEAGGIKQAGPAGKLGSDIRPGRQARLNPEGKSRDTGPGYGAGRRSQDPWRDRDLVRHVMGLNRPPYCDTTGFGKPAQFFTCTAFMAGWLNFKRRDARFASLAAEWEFRGDPFGNNAMPRLGAIEIMTGQQADAIVTRV